MRIAELARTAGVPVSTVKYYLRTGILAPAHLSSANQGHYTDEHVARLRLIRELLTNIAKTNSAPLATIRHMLTTAHPEDHCWRCAGPNITWTAPSPLWNQVMRGGDINNPEIHNGIVCPTCFATLANEAGITTNHWKLFAARPLVALQHITPSGRIWNPERWQYDEPDQARPSTAAMLHAYASDHHRTNHNDGPWETCPLQRCSDAQQVLAVAPAHLNLSGRDPADCPI